MFFYFFNLCVKFLHKNNYQKNKKLTFAGFKNLAIFDLFGLNIKQLIIILQMKKISIYLSSLFLGIFFFSCSENVNIPKADLKTEKDSLAYAIGLANSTGISQRLAQSRIDSIFMNDYIQGILDGATAKVDTQKIAYFIGAQMGQQFSDDFFKQFNAYYFKEDSAKFLKKEVFLSGLIAGMGGKDLKMSLEEAPKYAERKLDSIGAIAAEEQYGENRAAGVKFLEENKAKDGVVTLPSGLQYKVIKEGKGEKPKLGDRVRVEYSGTLIDGTQFDSSKNHKEPSVFGVTDVIPGWTEALQLMPVGSKWELYVPQELAYGSQDRGTIKPFSMLIFEMELQAIEKPKEETPALPQE